MPLKTMNKLFKPDQEAIDYAYNCLCYSTEEWVVDAKKYCEKLWEKYYPYADNHFLIEIQRDFNSRFWEMYLACSFLDMKIDIDCPKPGPDIKIIMENYTVWIEAIAPEPGASNSMDKVKKSIDGKVQSVPEEQIILRYRNAIHEKYNRKYHDYQKNNIIKEEDRYIIAINGSKIPSSRIDFYPPRIVRSVFPIGYPEILINKESGKTVKETYHYRENVKKQSGSLVSTAVFFDDYFENLSAVIFSNVDPLNRTSLLGEDFILVHNPRAKNPIETKLLKRGTEYRVTETENKFDLFSNVLHEC